MMKITRQEPITPPMIFPMMPEMRKLPASQLKRAPPTIPMITLIYQGNDVFMSIPAIQPQTPAITSEMINSIIVNSFSIRQSGYWYIKIVPQYGGVKDKTNRPGVQVL